MNIIDYADSIGATITIMRYPNSGKYIYSFLRCDTKNSSDDCLLTSSFGIDNDIFFAQQNYIDSIKGKILVFSDGNNNRREFTVPESLSYE